MAKHPTSSRVHRDSHETTDDAFVAGVERSVAWAKHHQRILIILGVVVVAAVLVTLYVVNTQRRIETEAARQFTTLQSTIASGNTQLAIRDLQTFVDRFGSSEVGRQARIVLAEILLREGQPQQAIDALGDLPEDVDESLGAAAARIEGAAHEALGAVDQAVALYVRIAEAARFDFQAREALADAARVRLQNGDADQAVTLYERVLQTFDADDTGRGYYEMWLAEARARAGEGAAAPVAAESAAGTLPDTTGGE